MNIMFNVATKNICDNLIRSMSSSNKIQFKVANLYPGQKTSLHSHHDVELWFVIKGNGLVHYKNHSSPIKQGDLIFHQPLQPHAIENNSNMEDLEFISVWWNDFKILDDSILRKTKNALINSSRSFSNNSTTPPKFFRRIFPLYKKINEKQKIIGNNNTKTKNNILILPSFPTPNGDLHLGHISGPYVAADIYKRFNLMMGHKAYCLLGTIGYQTQVAYKAKKLGLTFLQTSKKYSKKIKKTLSAYSIQPEVFLNSTENHLYEKVVLSIFKKLHKNKNIIAKKKSSLYCNACKKYLFEAHVKGECPYCKYDNASSNECEKCALIHEDKELIKPICMDCGNIAILKPLKRIYFDLEPYRGVLQEHYKKINLSSRLKEFIDIAFSKRLPEIPISHIANAGIKVPLEEFQGQVIFSLFELAGRYISAVNKLSKKTGYKYWLDICNKFSTKIFFGYDNAFLRVVIFPAVLIAYDNSIILPDLMVSNEFYKLNGFKFSTSRNHAVWGIDLVKQYSSDAIRFYLSYTRPEKNQTNFFMSRFEKFTEEYLIKGLATWLESIETKIKKFHGGYAPEAGLWNKRARIFYMEIKKIIGNLEKFYKDEGFSPQKICHQLIKLITLARNFSKSNKNDYLINSLKENARTNVALELLVARSICIFSWPIMPEFALSLWNSLGYKKNIELNNFKKFIDWVPTNQEIKPINIKLFYMIKEG